MPRSGCPVKTRTFIRPRATDSSAGKRFTGGTHARLHPRDYCYARDRCLCLLHHPGNLSRRVRLPMECRSPSGASVSNVSASGSTGLAPLVGALAPTQTPEAPHVAQVASPSTLRMSSLARRASPPRWKTTTIISPAAIRRGRTKTTILGKPRPGRVGASPVRMTMATTSFGAQLHSARDHPPIGPGGYFDSAG